MSRHCEAMIAPHQKSPKSPKTVAEVLAAVERKYAAMAPLSRKEKRLLRTIRRTCKRIAEFLNQPLEGISLDDLVDIDKSLIDYIAGLGIDHQTAVQYVCDKDKLLDLGHRLGWTSADYELRRAWQPIRTALRGRSKGCGSIIRFAIKHKKTPATFNQELIDAWMECRLGRGRSLLTVDIEECHFREVLRNAGLKPHFSNWSLDSKNPPPYRLRLRDPESEEPLPDLPETLREEILEVIRWKTADEDLDDRDVDLLIRPVSGQQLLRHFLELYSYANKILGVKEIFHLDQLLKEKIVCEFIAWLQKTNTEGVPRCKQQSIINKLSGIHGLTRTYPKFTGGDYGWFKTQLDLLSKEAHSRVQLRKLEGNPDYETVANVSSEILALRQDPKGIPELDVAWLFHDALLFAVSVTNPYRSRTLREAKFHPRKPLIIFETEITTELLNHLKLPPWAAELRDKDPKATFVVFHALEVDMKAGQEVWQLLSQEAAAIFKEYVRHYRPLILRTFKSNATTLFLARNGNALTQKSLLNLVKRISVRHTKRRMTVKLFRDLVGAHMLASGATIEEVADCLTQLDPYRTTARFYVGGYNASHGVSALEDEIAALAA